MSVGSVLAFRSLSVAPAAGDARIIIAVEPDTPAALRGKRFRHPPPAGPAHARRLDVKEEDDRKGGRSRTKPRRAGDAVDALIRRGPTHGSDVLELCRIVLEEQLNGRVTVSVVP